MSEPTTATDETQVRLVLQRWATATRKGQRDHVLANHLPDVLMYDVLAPMKYEGATAYRQSWDEWQPETQGEGQFDLQDLSVTAGVDVAFAHCFMRRCLPKRQDVRGSSSCDVLPAHGVWVVEGGAPAHLKANSALGHIAAAAGSWDQSPPVSPRQAV